MPVNAMPTEFAVEDRKACHRSTPQGRVVVCKVHDFLKLALAGAQAVQTALTSGDMQDLTAGGLCVGFGTRRT